MQNSVVYEQPLNEKMRTLLRLEFLFQQGRHYAVGESAWDSRAAISTLLDIQGILMGRTDLKGDLIKEMDRQIQEIRRTASTLPILRRSSGMISSTYGLPSRSTTHFGSTTQATASGGPS